MIALKFLTGHKRIIFQFGSEVIAHGGQGAKAKQKVIIRTKE